MFNIASKAHRDLAILASFAHAQLDALQVLTPQEILECREEAAGMDGGQVDALLLDLGI